MDRVLRTQRFDLVCSWCGSSHWIPAVWSDWNLQFAVDAVKKWTSCLTLDARVLLGPRSASHSLPWSQWNDVRYSLHTLHTYYSLSTRRWEPWAKQRSMGNIDICFARGIHISRTLPYNLNLTHVIIINSTAIVTTLLFIKILLHIIVTLFSGS